MQWFWLATWDLDAPTATPGGPSEPLVVAGSRRLAIEVLHDGPHCIVLLSTADRLDEEGTLECRIGFVNDSQQCSEWRCRGFPVIEAEIRMRGGKLEVLSSYFGNAQAMHYGELLLAVRGVRFGPAAGAGIRLKASYQQSQEAPQPRRAATFILRKEVRWEMARSRVRAMEPQPMEIDAPPTRSPSLVPITDGMLAPTQVWSGTIDGPPAPEFSAHPPSRVRRRDLLGEPGFDFRDIEMIGFGLNLQGADVQQLLAPLNVRPAGAPSPGFKSKVISTTVLVELLRYGSMRPAGVPLAPLRPNDFQSQHELVVRVHTAKVRDGETQERDPAIHVPAIFVDNPWSKLLGRDYQGFEKTMADFCVPGEEDGTFLRLRPDGRLRSGGNAAPLSDITRLLLTGVVASGPVSSSPVLLEIELEGFNRLLEYPPREPGWRISDFDVDSLAPGFAAEAVRRSLTDFTSIQATPVEEQRRLDKAWVFSTCKVRNRANEDAPSARAHLVFHALDAAPPGWRKLCELLGATPGGKVRKTFQALQWYRGRFSMELEVHDA
jgi:hypothetical protein